MTAGKVDEVIGPVSPHGFVDMASMAKGRKPAVEKGTVGAGVIYDVCFAPHKEYHVVTARPVAEILRRRGIEVSFLDFTSFGSEEETLARPGERHWHDVADFLAAGHGFNVLVVFNDWDPLVARPLVMEARDAGAATVGFAEGINDFHDADTGRRRDAYRTVEWVLGAGENDRQYFRDVGSKFQVVGFPRIAPLLERPAQPPERTRAVINVNFTYDVLENERGRWLDSAIEGCRLAGMEWIVSQHPQDGADLSSYPVDRRSFEESMRENAILISRFSSCIIEALAMGRPVVYYNPHDEKVEKFREPLGAYGLASDPRGLARAVRSELERADDLAARRMKFLGEHCDVSRNWKPHEKAADALARILAEHRKKQTTGGAAWRGDRSALARIGRIRRIRFFAGRCLRVSARSGFSVVRRLPARALRALQGCSPRPRG